jgi:hypothetical protein
MSGTTGSAAATAITTNAGHTAAIGIDRAICGASRNGGLFDGAPGNAASADRSAEGVAGHSPGTDRCPFEPRVRRTSWFGHPRSGVGGVLALMAQSRRLPMTYLREMETEGRATAPIARPRGSRWIAAAAACAAAWSLSACGGGAYADSAGNFLIGVTVAGQFAGYTPVAPGGSLNLAVHAGQSVTFDAGEPAIWTMYVGGSAVSGAGQVYYAGANISATTLSQSSVALDTYAAYWLPASIPITLVATSTYDSAQVATVNLLITN